MRSEIAEALRQKITAGELVPGTRIAEDWVSTEMGVSHGPVREALRTLENEGLVVVNAYKGASVIDVSTDELRNVLIPVRFILERQACLRAIGTMTEENFDELGTIVTQMRQTASTNDPQSTLALVDLDVKFHELLTEFGHQYHTLQLWRSIESRIRVGFVRLASQHHALDEIADEHEALLKALRTGDPEIISDELEEHIRTSVLALIDRAEASDSEARE
jgi:DNA-binding GntR family transcriptional regulator